MKFSSISLLTIALVALLNCNKKSDSSDSSDDGGSETGTAGTIALSDNELATVYPEGMNVTAFPTDAIDSADVDSLQIETELTRSHSLIGKSQTHKSFSLQNPPPQDGCTEGTTSRLIYNPTSDTYENLDAYLNDTSDPNSPPKTNPSNICEGGDDQPPPAGGGDFQPHKRTGVAKLKEEKELLNGTADQCFSDNLLQALNFAGGGGEDRCFSSETGVMKGTSCSSDEACLVKTARGIVESNVAKIESALGLMQALLCQAKKDGKEELPKAGKVLDLTATLSKTRPNDDKAPTITKAQIERLPDANKRPVFKTTIHITQDGKTAEYNIAHSPSESGNSNYDGTLWIKRPHSQQGGGQQGGGQPANGPANLMQQPQNGSDVTSVRYSRSGTTDNPRVKMEVRSAVIEDDSPFTKTGLVNYNAGADMDESSQNFGDFPGESNNYIAGIFYSTFDINPVTSEGSLAFWNNPGGSFTESARGFVFDVQYNAESERLEGCGIAGAGVAPRPFSGDAKKDFISSIRQATYFNKPILPTGFYTPQICWRNSEGNLDNVGPTVWKQCFKQNDQGVYEIDTAKTTDAKGFDIVEATKAGVEPPDVSTIEEVSDVN